MESTTTAPAPTKITATELARNLSDVLNRVRYRGEHFIVERNGEVVAVLEPKPEAKKRTREEFLREFGHMKLPHGFADALEDGMKVFKTGAEDPWQSL
ncbi:MAG: type II toxin-antitoxin system Phd/YefM family antitoxin [Chloroflexi bacterium]|nr:type II toxin-antitoxin system Phd/YefM family antitoxin [Chloroflexota bacterium]